MIDEMLDWLFKGRILRIGFVPSLTFHLQQSAEAEHQFGDGAE